MHVTVDSRRPRLLQSAHPSDAQHCLESVVRNCAHCSNTELFKMGMVQILLSPNPFASGTYFNHTLDLASAAIELHAGGTAAAPAATMHVWVDANNDVLTVDVTSPAGTPYSLTVTTWSLRPNTTWTYSPPWFCDVLPALRDVMLQAIPQGAGYQPGSIVQYHQNNNDTDTGIVSIVLTQQNLTSIKDTVPDWWTGRVFGYAIDGGDGPALVHTGPSTLASAAAATAFTVRLTALSSQPAGGPNEWAIALGSLVASLPPDSSRWSQHTAYWGGFWGRSWIGVNASSWGNGGGSSAAWAISQQYAITRFVQVSRHDTSQTV